MPGRTNNSRSGLAAIAGATISLLLPIVAEAHDYWLVQEPSTLQVGDTCSIRLLVGDRLEPEVERALQREITTRHEWLTARESVNLLKALPEGTKPVFQRSVTQEETALLVMDRDFVDLETTYGRFAEFLDHEQATEIAGKVKTVANDTKLRRRYARNLKALVRVGAGDSAGLHARRVGQKLEIVLLDDPWSVRHGEELGVQIYFDGEPLEGQWVKRFVGSNDGSIVESSARTDSNGSARFVFERSGLWVIRVAYVRVSADRELADWDTHYATFSLQLPAVDRDAE